MTRLLGSKEESYLHPHPIVRDVLGGHECGVICDIAWNDGRLFTQVLLKGRDEVQRLDTQSRQSLKQVKTVEALTDALISRLPVAAQGTLQLLLYTPRFGRINVRLKRERNTCEITLTAEDEASTQRLLRVQEPCREALENALEQTVMLRVSEVAGS